MEVRGVERRREVRKWGRGWLIQMLCIQLFMLLLFDSEFFWKHFGKHIKHYYLRFLLCLGFKGTKSTKLKVSTAKNKTKKKRWQITESGHNWTSYKDLKLKNKNKKRLRLWLQGFCKLIYILDDKKKNYILAPHPKLANRWGARGSGGALAFHCYFLTNKDNKKTSTNSVWPLKVGP